MSMTLGNRILIVLLAMMLTVSLGYLIVGSIRQADPASKYVKIYDGRNFSGEEKRAVDDALAKENLSKARWVGDKLEVPVDQRAAYAAAISRNSAVRVRSTALNETINNLSTWESRAIIDEKKFQATAQVVADEIAAYPEIANATVVPNKRDNWNKNVWAREKITSLTVYVDTVFFQPLPENTVAAIGHSVATAFGITNMREITIADRKNSRTYYGNGDEVGTTSGGAYSKAQKKQQEIWNAQIHNVLNIKGLQVQTSVVLKTKFNERALDVTQRISKEPFYEHTDNYSLESQFGGRFGRPGQIAMGSVPLIQPIAGRDDMSKLSEKRDEREATKSIGGIEERFEFFPLVPERIMATLRIPRDYVLENWRRNNPAAQSEPTPEQITETEEMIRRNIKQDIGTLLLPYKGETRSADPYDMVQVSFYNPIVEPEIILTRWEQVQQWLLQNWHTLGLMGLVVSGLCVLWSVTRPVKPAPIVIYEAPEVPMDVIEAKAKAKADAEAAVAATEAAAADEDIDRTLEPFGSIRSIRDEIAELVEENPEAAAAVLRQWIGNVAMAENK
ncbi:MAG: hypothetical protein LBQ66_08120 [Planctomycetaceae bacterium]|nr:hypothetical protein [Planctomycetaceae bacterium]